MRKLLRPPGEGVEQAAGTEASGCRTQACFALQGATARGCRRCESGKREAHRVSSTGTPKAQVKISEGEKPVVCGNTTTVNERMAAVE